MHTKTSLKMLKYNPISLDIQRIAILHTINPIYSIKHIHILSMCASIHLCLLYVFVCVYAIFVCV